MANNGFWDRFSQAYTPASQQGSAAMLKRIASEEEKEREDLLRKDQRQFGVTSQLFANSKDPYQQQALGQSLVEGEYIDQGTLDTTLGATARNYLKGLSPEEYQKMAENEIHGEQGIESADYQGPFTIEMFGEANPVQTKKLEIYRRSIAAEDQTRMLELAKALPEYMRPAFMGIDTKGLPMEDPATTRELWAKREDILRREYLARTGKFTTVQASYANLIHALEGGTGASDQALVMMFAKMLDPDSIVREGEYATTAKNAQSFVSFWLLKANRLTDPNAPFLGESGRQNIYDMAKKMYEGSIANLKTIERGYRDLATRAPVDLEYILGPDPRGGTTGYEPVIAGSDPGTEQPGLFTGLTQEQYESAPPDVQRWISDLFRQNAKQENP